MKFCNTSDQSKPFLRGNWYQHCKHFPIFSAEQGIFSYEHSLWIPRTVIATMSFQNLILLFSNPLCQKIILSEELHRASKRYRTPGSGLLWQRLWESILGSKKTPKNKQTKTLLNDYTNLKIRFSFIYSDLIPTKSRTKLILLYSQAFLWQSIKMRQQFIKAPHNTVVAERPQGLRIRCHTHTNEHKIPSSANIYFYHPSIK